ncbi:MAG TPA: HNH endonuclease [Leptospiraceae bacterium]|nr:HNH endonuclease [Leptospirales bacterium]HMU84799.1 HNH endonuclease [Leptospiraceae bacterium]HMW59599.1 HNH endonuclease [Leptospiraceae bacterium]HMX55642.1 HNH endonuclease [Leptospiraceae bacterium]HMY44084.1 HNH endonuclease [Leptospiraceae bacterium]
MATSDFLPHYGPRLDERELAREKDKARKLRDSPWWRKKKQSGVCYYCRKKFKPADLTMDHLIPLARGGRSVKENLVPCCKDCNNKKRYYIPAEWNDYLKSLRGEEPPPENQEIST